MKKKWISLFMAAVCMLVFLTGCGRTEAEPEPAKEDTKTIDIVRVASLKGPTSMGLVSLQISADFFEGEKTVKDSNSAKNRERFGVGTHSEREGVGKESPGWHS